MVYSVKSMLWQKMVLAVVLVTPTALPALDDRSQIIADRYLALVTENPANQSAFAKLWELYAVAGETEGLLTRAQALAAKDDRARLAYARLLQQAGQSGRSTDALKQIAGGDFTAAQWIELGRAWQKAGDSEEALKAWEAAVKLSPNDMLLRRELASACIDARLYPEAMMHLQILAASAEGAEKLEALEQISSLHERMGELSAALEAQAQITTLLSSSHWKYPAALKRLMALHRRADSLDTLRSEWEMALEQHPSDLPSVLRLADLAEFETDFPAAIQYLRTGLNLSPKDAKLAVRLAKLEREQGRLDDAIEHLQVAVKLEPSNQEIVFTLAETEILRGNEAGALAALETFRNSQPDNEATRLTEVDFYRRLRLYTAWESALRKRLKEAPDDLVFSTDLAGLYLQLGRENDALAVLEAFPAGDRDPAARRELYSQFARLFREARRPSGSFLWARKAWELPGSGAIEALQLADALWAAGDSRGAVSFLEEFCAKTDLPPEDVDRRLFLALQSQAGTTEEGAVVVSRKAGKLLEKAGKDDTTASWLRAARWGRWSGQLGQASIALQECLRLEPESPEALENLASVREAQSELPAAIKNLSALARIQPDRRPELERRIARLEIQAGNAEAGIAILRRLAQEQPGQWQPLTELAAANQAAGNWFEALEILLKATAIAPPQEQGIIRSSILKACDRLRLPEKALSYLESSARSATPEQRGEILRDAAIFAEEQKVLPAWQERVWAARAAFPHDSAWIIAAAELAGKTQGKEAMQDALAWIQADKAESLETLRVLVKQAADAQDWPQAALLSRRAALLSSPPSASLWLETAGYLERAGDIDGLRQHWQSARYRFPNDPEVLLSAADYLQSQGDADGERALLLAASRLDKVPPRALLRLGKSWLAAGDRNQAFDTWQRLLQQTPADPTQARRCFPLPPGVFLNTRPDVIPLPSEREAEGCRLLAIAAIGDLLKGSPARDEWLKDFDPKLSLERIWAYYHAGLPKLAIEGIAKAAATTELQAAATASLVLLSLSTGDFTSLAPWIENSLVPARSWTEVIAGLRELLVGGWRPTNPQTNQFLSSAPAYFRWQAAESFAAHGLFRSATALGKSAVDEFSVVQSSSALLALADWQMNCRDEEAMLSALDQVVALGTGSSVLTAPFYSALRVSWLLADSETRKQLEATALQAAPSASVRQTILLLIAALQNDHESFSAQARVYWENLRDTDDANRSALLLQSSFKLQEWGMEAAARELCRAGLQGDPAMQVLQGDQHVRNSLEASIFFSKMQEASPSEAAFMAAEWVGSGRRPAECVSVAGRLLAIGRTESARAVFEYLFSREPGNTALWNHLLALYPLAEFSRPEEPLAEWFLLAADADRAKIPAALVAQLASIIWNRGEPERALQIISLPAAPDGNGMQGLAKARMLVAMGRQAEALKTLESLSASHEAAAMTKELQMALGLQVSDFEVPIPPVSATPQVGAPAQTLSQKAMGLMEEKRWKEAADSFDLLDKEGLPGAVQTLAYAQALWMSGRRADAIDIADFVRRFLVIDPSRSVDLAAFYIGVDRPYAAVKLLQEYETPSFLSRRRADLWQQAAAQFLSRGALNEARAAMAQAANHPSALNPTLLIDLMAAEGPLRDVDTKTIPFELNGRFLAAFRLAMAQRMADLGEGSESLSWLETDPGFLNSSEGRKILTLVENADPQRAAALWEIASMSPLAEARRDAAAYLARQADEPGADRLALLLRAHKIFPGSVAVTRLLAQELPAEEGKRIVDETLAVSLLPGDRSEMQQWQKAFQTESVVN